MLRSPSINVSGLVVVLSVAAPSRPKVRGTNGKDRAVYDLPIADERAAASFSWSNAGFLVAAPASTRTNSVPPFTDRLYQKWSVSPIQLAAPGTSVTSSCDVLASA